MALSSFVSPGAPVLALRNSFNQNVARQYFAIVVGGANKSRTLARWGYG